MYTLLPEQQIKGLEKEYHIRVAILLTFFLAGAVWLGIASLFPSYIISVVQEKNAESQVTSIQKTATLPAIADTAQAITDANAMISRVNNGEDNVLFSSIIENIDNHRTVGITLTDFELAHDPSGSSLTQTTVSISGHADTRDELVAFKYALDNDTEFSTVDLPISDLSASEDIKFTISLTGLK